MISQLRAGLGILLPLFTQDTSLAPVVISQEYTVTGLIGEKLPHDELAHFQFDLEERECERLLAIMIAEMRAEVAAEKARLSAENRAS